MNKLKIYLNTDKCEIGNSNRMVRIRKISGFTFMYSVHKTSRLFDIINDSGQILATVSYSGLRGTIEYNEFDPETKKVTNGLLHETLPTNDINIQMIIEKYS